MSVMPRSQQLCHFWSKIAQKESMLKHHSKALWQDRTLCWLTNLASPWQTSSTEIEELKAQKYPAQKEAHKKAVWGPVFPVKKKTTDCQDEWWERGTPALNDSLREDKCPFLCVANSSPKEIRETCKVCKQSENWKETEPALAQQLHGRSQVLGS